MGEEAGQDGLSRWFDETLVDVKTRGEAVGTATFEENRTICSFSFFRFGSRAKTSKRTEQTVRIVSLPLV